MHAFKPLPRDANPPLPLDPQAFSQLPLPKPPVAPKKQDLVAADYGRCQSHYLAQPLTLGPVTLTTSVGVFKGTRRTYEDRWSIDVAVDGQAAVYAVFDGHNGPWTADYLRQHLGPAVLAHPEVLTSPEVALASAFAEADEGILAVQRESLGRHSGSTAVVCLLTGDRLTLANVGDSRATVVDTSGKVCCLTTEHRASRKAERDRVGARGGEVCVASDGVARVGGVLEVSRAFGHCALNQFVQPEPDFWTLPLDNVRAVLLATDGLKDAAPNGTLVSTIKGVVPRPAEALARLAKGNGASDNVCALVVRVAH